MCAKALPGDAYAVTRVGCRGWKGDGTGSGQLPAVVVPLGKRTDEGGASMPRQPTLFYNSDMNPCMNGSEWMAMGMTAPARVQARAARPAGAPSMRRGQMRAVEPFYCATPCAPDIL